MIVGLLKKYSCKKFLKNIMDNLETFPTEYDNSIFYRNGNKVMFEYSNNTNTLIVNDTEIWSVLERKMKYYQIFNTIESLFKDKINSEFKLKYSDKETEMFWGKINKNNNMKTLIVVDVQNDFCPGGSLAVPNGDEIVPNINSLLTEFDLVIFTMDWHLKNMNAFASSYKNKKPFDKYKNKQGQEDVLWPSHCVGNTKGAELHPDIDLTLCKDKFYMFKKGVTKDSHPYSGFGAEGLLEFLIEKGVTETYIVGLATDYCVKDTAIDSVKNGFKTNLIWDLTKGISDDLGETLNTIVDNGVNVIDYEYFIENN